MREIGEYVAWIMFLLAIIAFHIEKLYIVGYCMAFILGYVFRRDKGE